MVSKFFNSSVCGIVAVGSNKLFLLMSRNLTAFSNNWLKLSYNSFSFAINFAISTSVILDLLVTLFVGKSFATC